MTLALRALVSLLAIATALPAPAKTLTFAGRNWTVRPNGIGGPRNNRWCERNAFVDAKGRLHLKLTKTRTGGWCAAEVHTTERMGFGTYQWQIDSRVDLLDRNVVFGLFNYPPPEVGPDATNEIDIEFTKWGYEDNENLNYTLFPKGAGIPYRTKGFHMKLEGTSSTHRFIWSAKDIRFQATQGHHDDNPSPIADWTYAPKNPRRLIPTAPMPIYMNLWRTEAPSNDKPVEVIISDFQFTPEAREGRPAAR